MDDLKSRLLELGMQGFECSQIMALVTLEMEGRENPDLIRAMSGLTGGLGHGGKICGALTGGCCVLGYFTGKGEPEEMEHNKSRAIINAYADWFEETYVAKYGGTDCSQIINGDFSKCLTVCGPIIETCYEKILELLYDNGVVD